MLSLTCKPQMLSVVMMNVSVLNVVAPIWKSWRCKRKFASLLVFLFIFLARYFYTIFVCLSIYISIFLPSFVSMSTFSFFPTICPSFWLAVSISPFCLSAQLSLIFPTSFYIISVCLSTCPLVVASLCLPVYLFLCLSISVIPFLLQFICTSNSLYICRIFHL